MTEATNLARLITSLSIENEFLADGELQNFPREERGSMTDEIVYEKLNLGRWQEVVEMIFGGIGKADVLFGGDREDLKTRILESAKQDPEQIIYDRTINTLLEKRERDLLFRLATELPFDYHILDSVKGALRPIFEDPESGEEKERIFNQLIGRGALETGEYFNAFSYFRDSGDMEAIGEVFEASLKSISKGVYSHGNAEEAAIEAALIDPEHKEDRLRQVILTGFGEDLGIDILKAFELLKEHEVSLSENERQTFYNIAAERISHFDLDKVEDLEFRLLWAKKHSIDEPLSAYDIFREQNYEGPEVSQAVKLGLSLDRDKHVPDREVFIRDVSAEHLRETYFLAPFEVKVDIAEHLEDKEKLKILSKEAAEKASSEKDPEKRHWPLKQAYDLWIKGGGDLQDPYITEIRSELIQEGREHFLQPSDTVGAQIAYDTFIEQGLFEPAYQVAQKIEDEEKIQRAREKMVNQDPISALRTFRGYGDEVDDRKGLDFLVETLAAKYEVNPETLGPIIEKYLIER